MSKLKPRLRLVKRLQISPTPLTCLELGHNRLAIGDESSQVKILALDTYDCLYDIKVSDDPVTSIVWLHDYSILCAAGHDLFAFTLLQESKYTSSGRWSFADDEINEIVFVSKDEVATVDDTGASHLFSVSDGRHRSAEHASPHKAMCTTVDSLGPKQMHYVTGGMDCCIKIWSTSRAKVVHSFDMVHEHTQGTDDASMPAINPPYVNKVLGDTLNGLQIIAALNNGHVFIAKKQGPGRHATWRSSMIAGNGSSITAMCKLDQDIAYVITATLCGMLNLWSLSDMSLLQTTPLGSKINALSADSCNIYVADVLGRLTVFRYGNM